MAISEDFQSDTWRYTSKGVPRGYIEAKRLTELWFHTGTACNLRCPFCLEGSKPGDTRLEQMTFDEVHPFMDEALKLGVEQFSFTGGEPFVNKDIIPILSYALKHRPVLVLTNGTRPLRTRLDKLRPFLEAPNPIRFRVSFDYPDPIKHDTNRGKGSFFYALETLRLLYNEGFGVSIARQMLSDENKSEVETAYHKYFAETGVPLDTHIIAFPDFLAPCAQPIGVPEITEDCMRTYHDEESRSSFMCAFSRMVVKQKGRMRIYACTLVDDDPNYDLGESLVSSVGERIMLRHHRCFSCFSCGASCSER